MTVIDPTAFASQPSPFGSKVGAPLDAPFSNASDMISPLGLSPTVATKVNPQPKAQGAARLIFPGDLQSNIKNGFPYISFTFIKYQDPFVITRSGLNSSTITPQTAKAQPAGPTIYLPLPAEFQTGVNPEWQIADTKVASGALQAVQDYNNSGVSAGDTATNILNNALAIINAPGANAIGGAAPNNIFNAANPKKQALFQGIQPRSFSFNWTFSPQSPQEAVMIATIARQFTKMSLPSLSSTDASFFGFPAECKIAFSKNVLSFPKISSCVCNSVSINLSPAGMQLLSTGHPIQTGISLSFTETDLRTQESPGI